MPATAGWWLADDGRQKYTLLNPNDNFVICIPIRHTAQTQQQAYCWALNFSASPNQPSKTQGTKCGKRRWTSPSLRDSRYKTGLGLCIATTLTWMLGMMQAIWQLIQRQLRTSLPMPTWTSSQMCNLRLPLRNRLQQTIVIV